MPAFNPISAPTGASAGPLNELAYAEETRGEAGLSATGGIFQLTPAMWATYAPQVGISLAAAPTPSAATGEEQRAVAAAIYNQYGFNPFIAAHPGIASRLPSTPQPQSVPIWGGQGYLSQLIATPEGSYFDPFGVGSTSIPTSAVGSVGSGANLTYSTGQPIQANTTLTGTPVAPSGSTSVLGGGGSGGLGSIGATDPFANIPSGYSEPSTGDTSSQQSSSGGLNNLAANVLSPVVSWAEGHLLLTAIIVVVGGGFLAYHGLLGDKFETFIKRFV